MTIRADDRSCIYNGNKIPTRSRFPLQKRYIRNRCRTKDLAETSSKATKRDFIHHEISATRNCNRCTKYSEGNNETFPQVVTLGPVRPKCVVKSGIVDTVWEMFPIFLSYMISVVPYTTVSVLGGVVTERFILNSCWKLTLCLMGSEPERLSPNVL